MELFSLSISLCNVSQKGHTYIKKTFTKGSIMEFFWTLKGRKKKKKRCNYSAFSSTSFEKNQPPTAIPTNTIQNVSFHGVDSGNECGITFNAGCANV